MSNANANSSKTSKKVETSKKSAKTKKITVSNNKNGTPLKIVGGPINIVDNELIMLFENSLNYSIPMEVDLSKAVGTHTVVYDKNGYVKERIDEEKGIRYISKNGKIVKARVKSKEEEK